MHYNRNAVACEFFWLQEAKVILPSLWKNNCFLRFGKFESFYIQFSTYKKILVPPYHTVQFKVRLKQI